MRSASSPRLWIERRELASWVLETILIAAYTPVLECLAILTRPRFTTLEQSDRMRNTLTRTSPPNGPTNLPKSYHARVIRGSVATWQARRGYWPCSVFGHIEENKNQREIKDLVHALAIFEDFLCSRLRRLALSQSRSGWQTESAAFGTRYAK